jgi:hypothetical protein
MTNSNKAALNPPVFGGLGHPVNILHMPINIVQDFASLKSVRFKRTELEALPTVLLTQPFCGEEIVSNNVPAKQNKPHGLIRHISCACGMGALIALHVSSQSSVVE